MTNALAPDVHDLPARLVLARHAESARPVAKVGRAFYPSEEARRPLGGIPDYLIPLTDMGKNQAHTVGVRLRKTLGQFDLAYHSGYLRAKDTLTGILGAYAPAETEMERRLRDEPTPNCSVTCYEQATNGGYSLRMANSLLEPVE